MEGEFCKKLIMTNPSPIVFEQIMQEISGLPLWIKHVIFLQLRSDLEKSLTKSTLDGLGDSDSLQLMVPQVTHAGKQELEQPSGRNTQELLRLLHCANRQKNVVNICIINNWTLEQCSILLVEAIEKQYVTPPVSVHTQATLLYLGNRIRIGDYLVKIGRLTLEQLDQALRTQRYIEESLGEKTGIANVLINLGYIHKKDSEGILFLKEESKKVFPFNTFGASLRSGSPSGGDTTKLQSELIEAREKYRQLELLYRQLQQQSRPNV
jgi:hypothetical protein